MTLCLLYYSFRKLPLGDATTIIFSSPVIVIALSFIFLKEPCGILRIAVITALFTGVVLVSKPPFLFQVRIHLLKFNPGKIFFIVKAPLLRLIDKRVLPHGKYFTTVFKFKFISFKLVFIVKVPLL